MGVKYSLAFLDGRTSWLRPPQSKLALWPLQLGAIINHFTPKGWRGFVLLFIELGKLCYCKTWASNLGCTGGKELLPAFVASPACHVLHFEWDSFHGAERLTAGMRQQLGNKWYGMATDAEMEMVYIKPASVGGWRLTPAEPQRFSIVLLNLKRKTKTQKTKPKAY